MSAQIIKLSDRRPPPPPPVNPVLETAAFWLSWYAESLHMVAAMLRPPR